MDRSEILANAVRALLANKLRASLAMLGIIVGISALVAIVALIEGASAYITERLVTLRSRLRRVGCLGERGTFLRTLAGLSRGAAQPD